ncbi:hypothetical protein HMPREF0262_03185 [Clostridium sp. ATCC 29733]|nr:hypothetical protein HMPREF0262_03185 [Clostridium sp. ATCC 29733]
MLPIPIVTQTHFTVILGRSPSPQDSLDFSQNLHSFYMYYIF